jgi:hypothetical protein
MINYNKNIEYGCDGIPNLCPDFTIKRHDTRPVFKVDITDCDLPVDLTGLVIEASMWLNTKLKAAITTSSLAIQFADNIGFEQINENTIIQIGDNRKFERMLIDYIDEDSKTIYVFRGQLDTNSYSFVKGSKVKLLRFINAPAQAELEYQDIENLDGTISKNTLVRSTLIYEWQSDDTCFWGKYFLEFKVMEVQPIKTPVVSNIPNYHCSLGAGVVWARRFPSDREGFLINIFDSPTAE